MGTIRKGILGGFSGKVGTVVGASWRGISYMRSLPLKVRNPRTKGQRSQRTKFSLALSLLKPITPLLRIGWKLYARRQSAFNAAMSHTLANAVIGNYPDYQIDVSKVLISRGNLQPVSSATATVANGNIKFAWNDNSGTGAAKQTDKTLIAILNLEKGEAITHDAGAERMKETQTVILPTEWNGNEVQAYLGFVSEDGREVANSVYLGAITL